MSAPAARWWHDPRVITAPVGDGLLLFDPARGRAHGLNPSGTLVWAAADGGARADDIVAAVTATVSGPPADPATAATVRTSVAADVAELLDQLAGEGLLVPTAPAPVGGAADDTDTGTGTEPTVAAPPPEERPSDRVLPPAGPPAPARRHALRWLAELGPYGALDVAFTVRTTDADLAGWLADRLAPLARPVPVGATVHRYEVTTDVGDPDLDRLLVLDDRIVEHSRTDAALTTYLLWHVNQLVCGSPSPRLLLHASAAVVGGRAVVLPAVMNSGKSTLVAGLVAAGAGYLTDECAAVDAAGVVQPYPKAIGLDPGSWPVLPDLAPADDPATARFEHHKWYVDPDRVRPGAAVRHAVPIGALVFPSYDPSSPTALTPLDPLDAAVELSRHTFNLGARRADGLRTIAALVTSLPCARLSVADLDSAVAAVLDAAAAPVR